MRCDDGKGDVMWDLEPRNAGSLEKVEKAKKKVFHMSLQEEDSPADTLTLDSLDFWPPEL